MLGNQLARIVVFGAEYCSFCLRTKTLLQQANSQFSYLDVEEEQWSDRLAELQR